MELSYFLEKYRPKDLNSFIGHDKLKSLVVSFVAGGDRPPHFLFVGPPGTGKTTMALIIANMLTSKNNILMVNASSDNKVDFFRNTIHNFNRTKTFGNDLKVVILDESDKLTSSAIALLKVEMEQYINTVFILTSNYPDKIDPAIKDRCVIEVFNYPSLEEKRKFVQWLGKSVPDDKLKRLQSYRDILKYIFTDNEPSKFSSDELISKLYKCRNIACMFDIVRDFMTNNVPPNEIVNTIMIYIIKFVNYRSDVIHELNNVARNYNNSLPQISIMATLDMFVKYVIKGDKK